MSRLQVTVTEVEYVADEMIYKAVAEWVSDPPIGTKRYCAVRYGGTRRSATRRAMRRLRKMDKLREKLWKP